MNLANEKLRTGIPKPPDVKDILNDILQKTNNIHVAFLFAGIGMNLLQRLELCLCATKDSLIYSGWKELSIQLGLDPLVPKCLQNCNIMGQDPVFTMLVAYTQRNEATVGKVYQGLYDIKRYDVITETQINVHEFYNELCNNFDMATQTKILKPMRIPTPPFIYQNLENNKNERRKVDVIKRKTKPMKTNKKQSAKIVMLTYRSQDSTIAEKIANEFRKERDGQRIGVILLQEHADKIYADRETLILKFFTKADYIIPIVSPDYLSCVSEKEPYSSAIGNIDSAYVKYIYDLITNNYVNDGCKNKKIRCIIPDEHFSVVLKHYFFVNPVFRTWIQLSEIEDLANKILKNQI